MRHHNLNFNVRTCRQCFADHNVSAGEGLLRCHKDNKLLMIEHVETGECPLNLLAAMPPGDTPGEAPRKKCCD